MSEKQKRKGLLVKLISRYPACEHLNMALWYLLKKPEENREAISEIVYAILKSCGYINESLEKTLKEMGFML